MNFKGLTIQQAIKKIQNLNESTFMIYVIERKTIFKDFKNCYKKYHLYDEEGKRIYYTTESLYYYFAEHNEIENDKIVIDSFIEIGHHSYLNISGWGSGGEGTHNEYYLVVDKLEPKNKGKGHLIKCDKKVYRYKDGELTKKQRRFTL